LQKIELIRNYLLLDQINRVRGGIMLKILQKDFDDIRVYFDELDMDESHFENSNDICTPLGCVTEMVDSIPASFWKRKSLKILDSCCGNGNFHAYIQTKTDIKNLHFNEINHTRIKNVENIFGQKINITTEDFLTFDNKEAFDLVVSNPPYAKFNNGKRVSKNHNLSRDFILKALQIVKPNGYILFIVPNNWMSFADRNVLPKLMSQYQFIHLNIHGAKKWFPKVGSSFTWFLLKKSPNKKPFKIENSYMRTDTQFAKLDKGVNFIPLYYSEEVRSILNKTLNKTCPKYKIETTSYLHHYTKRELISDRQSKIYRYKLIHTPSRTVWSKVPHKYQNGWKVFMSLTNKYQTFIDNCGMTQSIAFVRCASKSEAQKVKEALDNKIYLFLNNITRYGNFNNVKVLQQFPVLSQIKLSAKEEVFIEDFLQSK